MKSVSLLSVMYSQLPLETVARHEVGHAVMTHCCGGAVRRIIVGRAASGESFGRTFWTLPAPPPDRRPLVLSGGVLALYLHQRPAGSTFADFCDWTVTLEGRVLSASGAGDWLEILRLTSQRDGYGMDDFLDRAVRPYFDETIGLLVKAADQLDSLTELLVAQSPGIGRRALTRFFAGRPRSRWAERLDRRRPVCEPGVPRKRSGAR